MDRQIFTKSVVYIATPQHEITIFLVSNGIVMEESLLLEVADEVSHLQKGKCFSILKLVFTMRGKPRDRQIQKRKTKKEKNI